MKKSEIGKNGEEIANKFLIKKGYEILKRNYSKKFGEIDIIARAEDQTLVFIEVKTLLIKNEHYLMFMPEDNLTTQKYNRVKRMAEFFVGQNEIAIDEERGWQIDLIAIEISEAGEYTIRHYENI